MLRPGSDPAPAFAEPGAAKIFRSRARRADPRSCRSRNPTATASSCALGDLRSVCTPRRRASRSRYFSPISIALARSVVLMTCLILLRALEVLTSASQSLLGRWPVCVRISTTSPLRKRVLERHDAAVHLRADAAVADVGVNGIREVDRRRVARQERSLCRAA